MANYLYNGVELPDIARIVQENSGYPYVLILDWSDAFNSVYNLLLFDTRPCAEKGSSDADMLAVYNASYVKYNYYTKSSTEWEFSESNTTGKFIGIGSRVLWTNTDILNENGSVFREASEPEPKPEPEPDVPAPDLEWQGKDIYLSHNGAWVKCDAVRKMNGEWVTQDEYLI